MTVTKYTIIVYYFDANIKSGTYLQNKLLERLNNKNINNYIFIGIGHIGNFHKLRRRDFLIPSVNSKGDTIKNPKIGNIEKFYAFLKEELIPTINKTYKTNTLQNSIIGHSFGGLLTMYCFLKSDNIFTNFYALSPSIWINNRMLYNYNKLSVNISAKRFLYFSAGGLEQMNYILKETNYLNMYLKEKNYEWLIFEYAIHKNKTHNTQVPLSIDYILNKKL